MHVGDEWASDCVGAKTMRMRTILVPVPGTKKLADEVWRCFLAAVLHVVCNV